MLFSAKVETFEENTIIELPYIYYPGYEVRADGIVIEAIETENGFLGCNIPAHENLTVEVSYTGTSNMKVSVLISVLGVLLLVIYIWRMEREK